ncbi:alpha/beta fold hydrolase [Azospirillum picis]|uniref:Pimeloyl-ACP methyl ester carboxylesterase n=1 Tax=Azospirillum picis TaxID=488438 RepID=A0ABU0MQI1_9PROT|nr:alpha/beta hydrolase [Azospirillum picis]MBP2302023.1 pimeloyl-ACP methyl ester carboxylesterase [Azospirillum picis]MDQ0535686.1 pimeloyl-ACP methyl ester carboxylesterase [Azospirillum picis]
MDALRAALDRIGFASAEHMTWKDYEKIMRSIEPLIGGGHTLRRFDYTHTAALQPGTVERLRNDYTIPLAYTEWGSPLQPTLICLGGIANSARRFDYLARALSRRYHVLCMDWAGRGRSGWLAEQSDYSFEANVAQVLALIRHKRLERVTLLGSSLGGSVAMRVAAEAPALVDRLILNDIGPFIPTERRRRRAESVARHYVFRHPAQLFHRTGAAQKNDGPVDDTVLLHNSFHQTRWCGENCGRVYRHDIRALQCYRDGAAQDHEQWDDWHRIGCQILLVHGMMSDALLDSTIDRMMGKPRVSVLHVPDVGHTPTLSDPLHIDMLDRWLDAPQAFPAQSTVGWSGAADRILFR